MATERGNLQKLIRDMKALGWLIPSVYDSEETVKAQDPIKGMTETEALDVVFSVDCATIRFQKDTGSKVRGVFVVLGNSPSEVVSDYSAPEDSSDGFEAALDRITSAFND